jgi:hypothetical protein
MAEFTIEIDDDGLFDCIEHKIGTAVENYVEDMDFADAISNQLDTIDIGDDISDGISSFMYWDKIFSENGLLGESEVRDLIDNASSKIDVDLNTMIEELLRDFMRVSIGNRCTLGETFAAAVTQVVKEIMPDVLAEQETVKVPAFADDIMETLKSIHGLLGTIIESKS